MVICDGPFFINFLFQNAGKRKKRGRVVGGTSVRSNTEYPEYVALKTGGGQHYCGATILDANHILSAAHCRIDQPTDKIIAGTINRDGTGGSNHKLMKCTKHPQARKGKATWESGTIFVGAIFVTLVPTGVCNFILFRLRNLQTQNADCNRWEI